MPPRRSHNQLPFTLSGTANLTSVHQTGNGPEALTGGGVATVCALQGMRGVGKSQLASAFAQECEQAGWRFVGWVDASSRENAASELAGFARTIGVSDQDDPQEAAKAFVNWLNSTGPQEGLLVFDNVEQADDVTDLIPHGPGMRVLITTTGHTPVVGTPVEVGVYSPAQAVRYLETATGLGDSDGAARVAEDLGWLPVAVTQAAAAIKEWDYDYTGYRALLDELIAERSLDEVVHRSDGESYPVKVGAALRIAYSGVLDRLGQTPVGAAAGVMLSGLSVMAASGVPKSWLYRVVWSVPDKVDSCLGCEFKYVSVA